MSSVRMCDRCGRVFSERSEDWGTYTGTTMRKDERGRRHAVSETLDMCGACNGGPADPIGLSAIAGVPEAERLADVHHGQAAAPTVGNSGPR